MRRAISLTGILAALMLAVLPARAASAEPEVAPRIVAGDAGAFVLLNGKIVRVLFALPGPHVISGAIDAGAPLSFLKVTALSRGTPDSPILLATQDERRRGILILAPAGEASAIGEAGGAPPGRIARLPARVDGVLLGGSGAALPYAFAWGPDRDGKGGYVARTRCDAATPLDSTQVAAPPTAAVLSADSSRLYLSMPGVVQSVSVSNWTLSWSFETPPGANRALSVREASGKGTELVCVGRETGLLCYDPEDKAERGVLPVRLEIATPSPVDGLIASPAGGILLALHRDSRSVTRIAWAAEGESVKVDEVELSDGVVALDVAGTANPIGVALLSDQRTIEIFDPAPGAGARVIEIAMRAPAAPPPPPATVLPSPRPGKPVHLPAPVVRKPEPVPASKPAPRPAKPAELKPPASKPPEPAPVPTPVTPRPVLTDASPAPAPVPLPAPSLPPLPMEPPAPAPAEEAPRIPLPVPPQVPPPPPPSVTPPVPPVATPLTPGPVPSAVPPVTPHPGPNPVNSPEVRKGISGSVSIDGGAGGSGSGALEIVAFGPNNILREAARATPGPDGEYLLEGLSPGRYRVIVRTVNGASLPAAPAFRAVDMADGGSASGIDFRVTVRP